MDETMQFTDSVESDPRSEESVSITELFGKENLENIMQKVAAATGLAFVTIDYRGEPVTDLVAYSSFCRKIQASPERKILCEASSALGAVQAAALKKTYIYFCPCGLLEVAIPIVMRGQFLGGFIGGQIRCDDAPPDTVQSKNVLAHDRDYSREESFREDYEKMLHLPYEKFMHITELISLIVNQLGEKEIASVAQKKYHSKQMALQREKERRIELEKDLNESQLNALRSQMNDYFLMSTLTVISNLAAVENAPRTNEVVTMFAKFLSNMLKGYSSTELIGNEMKALERYLYIQKVRMGDKLEYTVTIPEDMRLQPIPSMLVFPFVERAIYYGVSCKQGNGSIAITAEYDQDDVVIRIADDGPGLKEKELASLFPYNNEGFKDISVDTGVKIARQRIIKYFGQEYDVKTEAIRGKGTVYTIRYPRLFDERGI